MHKLIYIFSKTSPSCFILLNWSNWSHHNVLKNWLKSDVWSMSAANDVFAQCCSVSHHYGHQGTVVQHRIFHFCLKNAKIHAFITFISHRWKSKCRIWPAIERSDKYKELYLRSWILSIPLQCINTSTVITGEGNIVSCCDVLLWDQWVYCICISIFCVEEESNMINHSFGLN